MAVSPASEAARSRVALGTNVRRPRFASRALGPASSCVTAPLTVVRCAGTATSRCPSTKYVRVVVCDGPAAAPAAVRPVRATNASRCGMRGLTEREDIGLDAGRVEADLEGAVFDRAGLAESW